MTITQIITSDLLQIAHSLGICATADSIVTRNHCELEDWEIVTIVDTGERFYNNCDCECCSADQWAAYIATTSSQSGSSQRSRDGIVATAIATEAHPVVRHVMGLNAWKIRTWAQYSAQKRMARAFVRAKRPVADWSRIEEA